MYIFRNQHISFATLLESATNVVIIICHDVSSAGTSEVDLSENHLFNVYI